jgi:hypothetical protein
MNEQLQNFIRDLAPVLGKHRASLYYTTADNGVHVSLDGSFRGVCLGFVMDGKSPEIERLLALANAKDHQ